MGYGCAESVIHLGRGQPDSVWIDQRPLTGSPPGEKCLICIFSGALCILFSVCDMMRKKVGQEDRHIKQMSMMRCFSH